MNAVAIMSIDSLGAYFSGKTVRKRFSYNPMIPHVVSWSPKRLYNTVRVTRVKTGVEGETIQYDHYTRLHFARNRVFLCSLYTLITV